MKKLQCQVVDGACPKFRIIATNPQNDSLTVEVGIFSRAELIRTIARFSEALVETISKVES